MGNTCSDTVPNVPDNSLTTLTFFVFTTVAIINAWAFKYIPVAEGKRKKALKATTGLSDRGFGLFANTFVWGLAYVVLYGAGAWFLFSVHNQCKWAFFLFVSLFGLSKLLDAFVWPYFYFRSGSWNKRFGLFAYGLGWLAELAIIVTWPVANFGGVAVHNDGSFGSFNLAFGVIGMVLLFIWLTFRAYVLYNLYGYNETTGAVYSPLVKQ